MLARLLKGTAFTPSELSIVNGAETTYKSRGPVYSTKPFFVLRHQQETWYCCLYKNRDELKRPIIQHANVLLKTDTGDLDWEFHHVIEKQHLSDLPLAAMGLGTIKHYYEDVIPTIMVSKKEHRLRFTNKFRIPEFRELYVSPSGSRARQQDVRAKENNELYNRGAYTAEDVKRTARELAKRYAEAYEESQVLGQLSKNFFEYLLESIDQAGKRS